MSNNPGKLCCLNYVEMHRFKADSLQAALKELGALLNTYALVLTSYKTRSNIDADKVYLISLLACTLNNSLKVYPGHTVVNNLRRNEFESISLRCELGVYC